MSVELIRKNIQDNALKGILAPSWKMALYASSLEISAGKGYGIDMSLVPRAKGRAVALGVMENMQEATRK